MASSIQDNLGPYATASLIGAGRALAGLPFEHPFDTIKTRMQAVYGRVTAIEMTRKLYKEGGPLRFYTGAIPNGLRAASKQMYRYPLMFGLPSFYKKFAPADAVPVLTGVTIASVEACLLTPLERLKVAFMTQGKQRTPFRNFVLVHKDHLGSALFTGIRETYLRGVVSWVSFLAVQSKVFEWERKNGVLSELSFVSYVRGSFVVGAVNTLVVQPFDTLKTSRQKNVPVLTSGVLATLREIYATQGFRGVYAGWQPRMVQYMIQAAVTSKALDHLERSFSPKK
jgi:hypothetical protein